MNASRLAPFAIFVFVVLLAVQPAKPVDVSHPQSDVIHDRDCVLRLVLQDLLTNPKLGDLRRRYSDPDSDVVVLINSSRFQLMWPSKFRPQLPSYSWHVHDESEARVVYRKQSLGIRLDRFKLTDTVVDPIEGNVTVTIMPLWESQISRPLEVSTVTYAANKLPCGSWAILCLSVNNP
jgi:hypothetical protein